MNNQPKSEFSSKLGICIFLAAIVWITFGQARHFDFLAMDDTQYVTNNPEIQTGLTRHGLATAFNYYTSDNCFPLTTISHMLDCQWYGLDAGKHHLTNVILHSITVILLFLALCRMTRAMWRSAFASAVFAVHPLRAESVAWISERKDVLCGVFFMLTLWTYAGYARNPRQRSWYFAAIVSDALALMSKPVAVTMPFLLLLLDYWPLNRFIVAMSTPANKTQGGLLVRLPVPARLIIEKIPFFMLSLASCILTLLCETPDIRQAAGYPVPVRIENAIVSYAIYIGQFIWPTNLRAFYFYSRHGPAFFEVLSAFIVLAAISLAAIRSRRQYPYCFVGWFWFLVVLLPVIGLVQVGAQAHADRHTYFSEIGLCLLLTWLFADFLARLPQGNRMAAGLAAVVLSMLIPLGHTQTSYWRNSGALWTHSLNCDPRDIRASFYLGNYFQENHELDKAAFQYENEIKIAPAFAAAHNRLGEIFAEQGELDNAIAQYRQATKADPNYALAHYKLGEALLHEGKTAEAVDEFENALKNDSMNAAALGDDQEAMRIPDVTAAKLKSAYSQAHNTLAMIYASEGRTDEAVTQFQDLLKLDPANAQAHNNLGTIFRQSGKLDEAIAQYQAALKLEPHDGLTWYNLGNALFQDGQTDEAMAAYQTALKCQPGDVPLQKGLARLAWMLATYPDPSMRNGTDAVDLAQSINRVTGTNNPVILRVLAAAYAENGRFSAAVEAGKLAQTLAASQPDLPLSNTLQQEIILYQSGTPVRSDPRETSIGRK